MTSKYDGDGIKKYGRPPINFVIVLDTSGSMECSFSNDTSASKIQIAKESLVTLLKHLHPEDRFALIGFTEKATVVQDLKKWGECNQEALKTGILDLQASGGTNLEAGFQCAMDMFDNLEKNTNMNEEKYESRIMYLTDMNPTAGCTNKDGLFGEITCDSQCVHDIHWSGIGL